MPGTTRALFPLALALTLFSPAAMAQRPPLQLVSVDSDGNQVSGLSTGSPSITFDGGTIVFGTASKVYLRDVDRGTTMRVDTSIAGVLANDSSSRPSISGDGRFVSFQSQATNLTADRIITGTLRDYVYLRDRDLNENGDFYEDDDVAVILASRHHTLEQSTNGISTWSSVSSRGRVSFSSRGTDLLPDQDSARSETKVFFFDGDPDSEGTFSWPGGVVSLLTDHEMPTWGWNTTPFAISWDTSVSDDGRFVAFISAAENTWEPPEPPRCVNRTDPLCVDDIFMVDRDPNGNGRFYEPGEDLHVWQVTETAAGQAANGDSFSPAISYDGRFVVFSSASNNLVDTPITHSQCYVYERGAATPISMVSVSASGEPAAGGHCLGPSISKDGRFVAFNSWATNLVEGDTNELTDTFVHDRDADKDGIFDEPGAIDTVRISVKPDGSEVYGSSGRVTAISGDGRYIAFTTGANLLPEDLGGADDVYLALNPLFDDVDGDGQEAEEEMGPDGDDPGWDGNGDDLFDHLQDYVVSLHSHEGAAEDYLTIAAPAENSIAAVTALVPPDLDSKPEHVELPFDVFEFTVKKVERGGAVTIDVHLPWVPEIEEGKILTWWIYGRTPRRPYPHWYAFTFDGETGAEVDAEDPSLLHLHYVDGMRGDEDLVANGELFDPGGPAVAPEPGGALMAAAAVAILAATRSSRRRRQV